MKIIEWGHKASFAYVTKSGFASEAQLIRLVHNICSTEQLLCSLCQGIYLDTDDMEDVYGFCELFINILQGVSKEYPQSEDTGLKAGIALKLRSLKLNPRLAPSFCIKGKDAAWSPCQTTVWSRPLHFAIAG